ncbi:hypothetical protein QC764_0029980 [Podospora pseudoanserina]|uniref:Uncharacterized protein n=1 Tax=Podospora pseudoanserina TaxID=2609844 RepID=A0ABR0IFR3_9PEZI|nr:hypothetical protein QC764_0029980 [Podospora pseudoanserina]
MSDPTQNNVPPRPSRAERTTTSCGECRRRKQRTIERRNGGGRSSGSNTPACLLHLHSTTTSEPWSLPGRKHQALFDTPKAAFSSRFAMAQNARARGNGSSCWLARIRHTGTLSHGTVNSPVRLEH